jgi:hypothetical protein
MNYTHTHILYQILAPVSGCTVCVIEVSARDCTAPGDALYVIIEADFENDCRDDRYLKSIVSNGGTGRDANP